MGEGWQFWREICGVVAAAAVSVAAAAAPPPGRDAMMPPRSGTSHASALGALHPAWGRPPSSGLAPLSSKLDLRAPADVPPNSAADRVLAPNAAPPFPSARRGPDAQQAAARLEQSLPRLGNDGPAVRTMGRAEEMVRRFHREGLPVARLFETRSALVHLGLNQRGKPGIWLIQKLP